MGGWARAGSDCGGQAVPRAQNQGHWLGWAALAGSDSWSGARRCPGPWRRPEGAKVWDTALQEGCTGGWVWGSPLWDGADAEAVESH